MSVHLLKENPGPCRVLASGIWVSRFFFSSLKILLYWKSYIPWCVFNLSTRGSEAGRSMWVQGQPIVDRIPGQPGLATQWNSVSKSLWDLSAVSLLISIAIPGRWFCGPRLWPHSLWPCRVASVPAIDCDPGSPPRTVHRPRVWADCLVFHGGRQRSCGSLTEVWLCLNSVLSAWATEAEREGGGDQIRGQLMSAGEARGKKRFGSGFVLRGTLTGLASGRERQWSLTFGPLGK